MKNNNLALLKQAYYERMMAYDQAYNATTDKDLKCFFEQQANESENILNTIESETINQIDVAINSNILPATRLFISGVYKKSFKFIIDSVRQIEKNMVNTYDILIDDLKRLPQNLATALHNQKKMFKNNAKYLNTY